MKALEFDRVSFQYPEEDFDIINELSFSVEPGSFHCIVGVSGCGKSTIFRMINGLLQPKSGEITVGEKCVAGAKLSNEENGVTGAKTSDGENGTTGTKTAVNENVIACRKSKSVRRMIGGQKAAAECKHNCGYMPQKDLLFPWRTIGENLALPLEIQGGYSKKEQRKMAEAALEEVGLAGCLDKRPEELSGGMRQRAAFARTMLTGSDLLLLDEPFSALDFLTRISMQEWLLKQWQKHGKTILFITHDVEEAIFLSSSVLVVESTPIRKLREVPVPLSYPRTREDLAKPEIIKLREQMVDMLRKQVAE